MKLELKHLVHYLPYGLRLKYVDKTYTLTGLNTRFLDTRPKTRGLINYNNVMPILRPLSDLTKEIEHNGERFTPSKVLTKENIGGDMSFPVNGIANYKVENEYERVTVETTIRVLDLLYEWHFDVFGLIEKGLAIDINSLRDE